MRVFVIHSYYQNRGGEDVVVEQEISLLDQENVVEMFAVKNKKYVLGAIQFLLYPWNIFVARKIIIKIKEFCPDVIHIHNLHYGIGPYVIRKIKSLNIPIVMTLHNYRLICPTAVLAFKGQIYLKSIKQNFPWSAIADKVHSNSYLKTFWLSFTYWIHKKLRTWEMVDKFILFSEFAKSNFLQSYINIKEDKFVIKPNGVEDFSNERKCVKYSNFLYLGRLSEEKGIIPLLNAVINTQFQLRIAGDGPQLNQVLEMIDNQLNIKYLGKIDKETVIKELNQSTALVLPSVCFEGMPISVLESFSLSNVALVCDLGVLKSIVRNGYNGFRFNPNDINSIQLILSKWLNLNEADKEKMRENARIDYLNKYTDKKNYAELIKIYQEVSQYPHLNKLKKL